MKSETKAIFFIAFLFLCSVFFFRCDSPAAPPHAEASPEATDTTVIVHRQAPAVNQEALLWMARTLYGEAGRIGRGANYSMELVGTVVMNRVDSPRWENTVKGVVTSDFQFTAIDRNDLGVRSLTLEDYHREMDNTMRLNRWRRAVRMAHHVLTMPDSLRPHSWDHYWSPQAMEGTPKWAEHQTPDFQLGRGGKQFRFYKLAGR